jgi:hypothetical protein
MGVVVRGNKTRKNKNLRINAFIFFSDKLSVRLRCVKFGSIISSNYAPRKSVSILV